MMIWSYLFLSCLQNTYEDTRKSNVQAIHPQMTFYLEIDFLRAI